jgi:hypothetical protein
MNPIRIAVALGAAALLLGGLAAPAFADETTSTTIDSGNITDGGSAVTATAGVTSGDRTATLLGGHCLLVGRRLPQRRNCERRVNHYRGQRPQRHLRGLECHHRGQCAGRVWGGGGLDYAGGTIAADNLSVASYGALSSNAVAGDRRPLTSGSA